MTARSGRSGTDAGRSPSCLGTGERIFSLSVSSAAKTASFEPFADVSRAVGPDVAGPENRVGANIAEALY